ncbi:MAG: hypothetical protein MUF78_09585 [Candidatus Edwardsbacteria bacterium]|nr:hypothetical protein [Candidatus Edwardsbacteria bacterium]
MITAGWTTAIRFSASISRILSSRSSDSRMPPFTASAPPESPVPAPRGVTGTFPELASSIIAATSAVVPGLTTTPGGNRRFSVSSCE